VTVDADHMRKCITAYCTAESAKDVPGWVGLFADDATHEDPVGAPVTRGRAALEEFFRGVCAMDLELFETAPPIVCANEAVAFLAVRVGTGAERQILEPIVDHFVFGEDGRFSALRTFFDYASLRPDPA
jgi:steroid Delta-isomerase